MELYNTIEKIFKSEHLMWSKIQILEDIVKWKPKFSRKKYTINEIDLTQNWIKFWVCNNWSCTTVPLENMLIYLSYKRILSNDYVKVINKFIINKLKDSKDIRLKDWKFLKLFDIIT